MHPVHCMRHLTGSQLAPYTATPAKRLVQAGACGSLSACGKMPFACRRRWTNTSRACTEARGRSRCSSQRAPGSCAWRPLQRMGMELRNRSGQGLRLAAWLPGLRPQTASRSPLWRSSSSAGAHGRLGMFASLVCTRCLDSVCTCCQDSLAGAHWLLASRQCCPCSLNGYTLTVLLTTDFLTCSNGTTRRIAPTAAASTANGPSTASRLAAEAGQSSALGQPPAAPGLPAAQAAPAGPSGMAVPSCSLPPAASTAVGFPSVQPVQITSAQPAGVCLC